VVEEEIVDPWIFDDMEMDGSRRDGVSHLTGLSQDLLRDVAANQVYLPGFVKRRVFGVDHA
jgi:hypothetical protein